MYHLFMSVTGQDLSRVDSDFEMVKVNLGEIIMVRIIFKGNNVRVYLLYLLQAVLFEFANHQYRGNHIPIFQSIQCQRNHIHTVLGRIAGEFHQHPVIERVIQLDAR